MYRSRTHPLPALLTCLTLLLAAACASAQQSPAKNVIILIADGCGFNQVAATSLWQHGELGRQAYQQPGWVPLAMSTYSVKGSYDPAKAWADPDYVKSGSTDSAAAATTLSTGVKTYNGAIGLGPDKQPLKHLMQYAEEQGKATGVVSSVPLSHATPAGFVAHVDTRNEYAAIAQDMFLNSAADVIMGGGHPHYNSNGERTDKPEFKFVGGEDTWAALGAGTVGGDADGDGEADPWTLIETKEQFEALAAGTLAPSRVAGVPQVAQTLQQSRSKGRPLTTTVPSLATMARGALAVLGRDPDGLVLMIEGGAVDWAGHGNNLERLVEEGADFNAAVQAVVEWVEANSSWDETLVIVTADHETGYLTAPAGDGPIDASAPLTVAAAGELPAHQFNSTGHTNSLVPLYARGPGAQLFVERATQIDPKRGPYVDNTDVAKVARAAMGVE